LEVFLIMKSLHEKSIPKPLFILTLFCVSMASLATGGMTTIKIGIQHGIVSGQSMEKTLSNGTKLLLINDDLKGIKRGDIVSILAYINGKRSNIMKRVIALPNDTIEIIGTNVYVNGNLIDEPYAYYSGSSKDSLSLTLHEDEYFVMGDNRLESQDSRHFGPVPKENILQVLLKAKNSRK